MTQHVPVCVRTTSCPSWANPGSKDILALASHPLWLPRDSCLWPGWVGNGARGTLSRTGEELTAGRLRTEQKVGRKIGGCGKKELSLIPATLSRNNIQKKRERLWLKKCLGFPGGSGIKESACTVGDLGLIPGSGRSPAEGNSYPLQYSCLENPKGRGAWRATIHGITKSWTRPTD